MLRPPHPLASPECPPLSGKYTEADIRAAAELERITFEILQSQSFENARSGMEQRGYIARMASRRAHAPAAAGACSR